MSLRYCTLQLPWSPAPIAEQGPLSAWECKVCFASEKESVSLTASLESAGCCSKLCGLLHLAALQPQAVPFHVELVLSVWL